MKTLQEEKAQELARLEQNDAEASALVGRLTEELVSLDQAIQERRYDVSIQKIDELIWSLARALANANEAQKDLALYEKFEKKAVAICS